MLLKNRRCATPINEDAIAERAYELWQARGCPHGDGLEDWQVAKAQLLAEAGREQRPLRRLFARWRNRAALA